LLRIVGKFVFVYRNSSTIATGKLELPSLVSAVKRKPLGPNRVFLSQASMLLTLLLVVLMVLLVQLPVG
jgi:hypothetical protein